MHTPKMSMGMVLKDGAQERDLFQLATLILGALIFYQSCKTGYSGPNIANADKVLHFLAYFILAFAAMSGWRGRAAWAVFLAVTAFGVGIEFIQHSFISGRTGSFADALANMAGTGAGIWIAKTTFDKLISRRTVSLSDSM